MIVQLVGGVRAFLRVLLKAGLAHVKVAIATTPHKRLFLLWLHTRWITVVAVEPELETDGS